MKKNFASLFVLTLFLIIGISSSVFASYIDKDFSGGKVRVHYSSSSPSSTDAVVIGVGTSMGRDDYDKLANKIIEYGYVVVVLDHNPGNMIKTDSNLFKDAANHVKDNLLNWLSETNITTISHWIMGGHSAGGQAAQGAINSDSTLADAIFSLDPYNCNDEGTVNIPAMYWGFNFTTCFVTQSDAAEAGYYKSLGKRALYRVSKVNRWTICGYSPRYFHCSFTDGDCLACTNCKYNPDHFYVDVANSVDKFINASFYGTWSKENLQINATTPVTLFEGTDSP